MATAKLTKRFIDSLKAPSDRFTMVWDSKLGGFCVRIMASGLKTYLLDYRDKHGRQHRIKIARHGVLTCEEARERAKQVLASIASGSDPIAERETARGAATFRTLAEEYIRYRCSEKKSGAEDERMIRQELLPHWSRKLAREISRRDVMDLTDAIKNGKRLKNKRRSPVMANRTLSLIRRLYNWGIDRELVESNPASHVKPRAPEKSRERVLENGEIKALWAGLDKLPGEPGTRLALKLILATAQRPGEIAALRWEEIDAENVWTIPAERAKNGRAHRVPLSPLAFELLHSLETSEQGPVFPSPRDPRKPITRAALAHLLNRGRELLETERFTPHDLRRTAASGMARMGVSRLVLSRILNHTDKGVTSVYDRHGYDAEKREALEAWGAKLSDIVAGRKTKIVSLVR